MDLSFYGTVVRVAAVYDRRVVQNKLPVLIEEIDTIDWVSVLQVSVTSNEGVFRPRSVAKNFCIVTVTSNLAAHAWSTNVDEKKN